MSTQNAPGGAGEAATAADALVEAVAKAIFEADEDLNDEQEARLRAAGNHVAADCLGGPRARWDDPKNASVLGAFRRRAQAAIAALSASPVPGSGSDQYSATHKGSGYLAEPEPQSVSGLTGKYPSRGPAAFVIVDPEGTPYWPSINSVPHKAWERTFVPNDWYALKVHRLAGWRCVPVYLGGNAQGTEAGTAETGTGSVHDGPVGLKADAPSAAPHPDPAQAAPAQGYETRAVRDVLAERRRQVEALGWTPQYDDRHTGGALALAAAAYARHAGSDEDDRQVNSGFSPEDLWTLNGSHPWRPSTPRRDLVKAGALILAEIERLDRASPPAPPIPLGSADEREG